MADWKKILSRGNVEDRRSYGPAGIGGVGLTGLALYFLATYLTGGNMADLIQNLPLEQLQTTTSQRASEFEGTDEYEVFASTVLGSINDAWRNVFSNQGIVYEEPRLVLFRTATTSECGSATSQVGPHYCPLDETIYLDETFFDEMINRFGAEGGDVAEAYVIAHEVGHHVQNRLGTLEKVQIQQQSNEKRANDLSISLELQADCYAGIWAHSIKERQVFEEGEIQEAMNAASSVGDDRIQERVTGYVNPETWTHGSSEQRVAWFDRGYESGDITQCNTLE